MHHKLMLKTFTSDSEISKIQAIENFALAGFEPLTGTISTIVLQATSDIQLGTWFWQFTGAKVFFVSHYS
jgi:hypothetical protein